MDMNNGVGNAFHYLHKMQQLFIFTLLKTRAPVRLSAERETNTKFARRLKRKLAGERDDEGMIIM